MSRRVANFRAVAIPAAGNEAEVIGPNPSRTALYFSSNGAILYFVSLDGSAAPNKGLTIATFPPGEWLRIEDIGETIRNPVRAVSNAGAGVAGVIEVIEVR